MTNHYVVLLFALVLQLVPAIAVQAQENNQFDATDSMLHRPVYGNTGPRQSELPMARAAHAQSQMQSRMQRPAMGSQYEYQNGSPEQYPVAPPQPDPTQSRVEIVNPVAGQYSPYGVTGPDVHDKVAEIEQRIELLKKMYEENVVEQEIAEPEPGLQPSVKLSATTSQPLPDTESVDFIPPLPPSSQSSTQVISAVRVLPEMVNPFEMGNSLLMTGNLQSALKAYEVVPRKDLNAFEAMWLEFMTATCRRKIGDIAGAESIYRDLANAKSAGPMVISARRWLKYIESTQRTRQTMAQMENEVNQLIETAASYADE